MSSNASNVKEKQGSIKNLNVKNTLTRSLKDQNSLNIQPIEKLVLIDQIMETIGRLMAEGVLKPGDVLPGERDLSEMLGVSRTSVSQALKALNVLGVLEIKPGSRTYLNKSISKLLINPMKFMTLLHRVSVDELFITRKTIEVALARLAAENATEDDIEKMRHALEESKKHLNDPKQYLIHEMDFHDAIFRASNNRILTAFMASINNLLIEVREKTVTAYLDLEDSLQQHIDIFNAIKNRNIKKAGDKMLAHLNKIESILSKITDLGPNI
jgi:GntR family transcriptional repressor for pyruvate dehydrogenase complex